MARAAIIINVCRRSLARLWGAVGQHCSTAVAVRPRLLSEAFGVEDTDWWTDRPPVPATFRIASMYSWPAFHRLTVESIEIFHAD